MYYILFNVCFIIKAKGENERNYLPMIVKKERIPEVRLKVVMMSVLKRGVDQGLRLEKTLKVSLMQRYVLSFVLYNNLHANLKSFITQIRRFVKSYKKFPAPLKRLDDIAADAELQEKPMSELRFLGEQLKSRCEACLSEFESTAKENKGEEEGKGPGRKRGRGPTFKIGGVMVNAKSFSAAVKELEPLEQALPSDSEQRSNWHIDIK